MYTNLLPMQWSHGAFMRFWKACMRLYSVKKKEKEKNKPQQHYNYFVYYITATTTTTTG